jgi:hypothetical protein
MPFATTFKRVQRTNRLQGQTPWCLAISLGKWRATSSHDRTIELQKNVRQQYRFDDGGIVIEVVFRMVPAETNELWCNLAFAIRPFYRDWRKIVPPKDATFFDRSWEKTPVGIKAIPFVVWHLVTSSSRAMKEVSLAFSNTSTMKPCFSMHAFWQRHSKYPPALVNLKVRNMMLTARPSEPRNRQKQ